MSTSRIYAILLQGLIAIVIVLYFSCFGHNPSFIGAFRDMWSLISDTIQGRNIMNNYYGLTWAEVWFTIRLIIMATAFSLLIGVFFVVLRIRLSRPPFTWLFQLISAVLEAVPEPMYVIGIVVLCLFLMNRLHVYSFPIFPFAKPSLLDTVVPALTLALPGAFYLERTLYLIVRDEVGKPYVSTAMSKGLSQRITFYKHVLPNGFENALRQMPVVASIVASSALFTEFFMGYQGALFQFTFASGWNMVTGYYASFQKPFQLPLYQPGMVFLIAALLVIVWVALRVLFEWLYVVRFGRSA